MSPASKHRLKGFNYPLPGTDGAADSGEVPPAHTSGRRNFLQRSPPRFRGRSHVLLLGCSGSALCSSRIHFPGRWFPSARCLPPLEPLLFLPKGRGCGTGASASSLRGRGTGPAGFPAAAARHGGISRRRPAKPRASGRTAALCAVTDTDLSPRAACPGATLPRGTRGLALQPSLLPTVGAPHGQGSPRWAFSSTSRVTWSLCPAAASPQTLSAEGGARYLCLTMPTLRDFQLSPKFPVGRETRNLISMAPAGCCKGQELPAVSRPSPRVGRPRGGLRHHLGTSSLSQPRQQYGRFRHRQQLGTSRYASSSPTGDVCPPSPGAARARG